ncbi:MAG: RIP metalloprotease RseP [Gammaproteobacteria bacterium]
MLNTIQTIAAFIVALGILVTIHEFGHYWVARKVGVKILRFSVGFGKPLWRTTRGPDNTEFVIAALPLGGYVKMLGDGSEEIPEIDRPRAFEEQTLLGRTLIVAAGPFANFLFAVFAYWLMYMVGVSGARPIIGSVEPDSLAYQAGLRSGYEITAVGERESPTWDNVFRESISAILNGSTVALTVRDLNGIPAATEIDFSSVSVDDLSESDFFTEIGVQPLRPIIAPRIGAVVPGEPAARAGLRAGDLVTYVNDTPVETWTQWVDVIREHAQRKLQVTIERDGESAVLSLTPARTRADDGEVYGRIGAQVSFEGVEQVPQGVERYGPIDALPIACHQTWQMVTTTLKFLHKMVAGEASVKNLSGPISIAQYAGQSAKLGVSRFLDFLALVSVSLGVLNLLPIPLLDGGHLLFYLVEFVTRRPVPESVRLWGQQLGLVLLLGLMGLAVFNDVMRIL